MKNIFGALFLSLLLVGCGDNGSGGDHSENTGNSRVKKGNTIEYGGSLKVAEEESNSTWLPTDVVDAISNRVLSQIHDGLVKMDSRNLSVIPAIASNWDLDESKTKYTFYLRDDVFFHDDRCFEGGEGRKVKASDFEFALKLLADPSNHITSGMVVDRIVGARDYFEGTSKELSGVKVIDDLTLEVNIEEPQTSFIFLMAMINTVAIAPEAYEAYGKELKVGTGAFKYVANDRPDERQILVYNEHYYMEDKDKNALPYLDSVEFVYGRAKLAELELFNLKELSILHGLPTTKIAEVVKENIANFSNNPPKTILTREPEMVVQYYEFVVEKEPFDNILVRKAFNYAIDRMKLLQNVLKDQGTVGNYGITPKVRAFNKYDYPKIGGYSYDPEKAKSLLAEAGYPNGEGFPRVTLEVNLGGNVHKRVATEIQQQLDNTLGVHIEVEQVSLHDKIDHSKYGKSEMFRSAWVADYPSPESFLSICFGGNVPDSFDEPSHPNTMRYKNEVFDSLYLAGVRAEGDEQMRLFAEAESTMMEDAPVMILWYQEEYTLYHSYVRNFHYNAMDLMDFSDVYIKARTAEEIEEAGEKIETNEDITPE